MARQISIAKITRPRLPEILPRMRLFRLLDRSRKHASVIWISGPAGSGKTTLVSSYLDSRKLPSLWYQVDEGDADFATFFHYMRLAANKAAPRYKRLLPLLTPEYGLGIPTFTRRFFENLCLRLKPPYVLIFDNYQEIPSESMFHEIIRTGLSTLPENITCIIISRSDSPAVFAGMQAENQLHAIGWNDLKLTLEESKGLAKLQRVGRPQGNFFQVLYEKTQGWAAGIVMLSRTVNIYPEALKEIAPENLFDYFANELFDQLDTSLRDFLLKTAFLPKVTPGLAEELTDIKSAGKILLQLNRRNFFTDKRDDRAQTYQYHPLFREFLLDHARKVLSRRTITNVQKHAATLLERAGDVEDAADIYRASGDWKSLTPLILSQGRSLAMQGRNTTLEKWLTDIPKPIFDKEPWLLYWFGICRQPFNPTDSRKFFERAFHLFKNKKNQSGRYLSWSAIANTLLFEWNNFKPLDQWIKRFDGRRRSGLKFISTEIEARVAASVTTALMIRQPDRLDISHWLERLLVLTPQLTDPILRVDNYSRVINYYFWTGNFKKVKSVREEIRAIADSADASPLVKISWLWLEAHTQITVLNCPDASLQCLDQALALADNAGVHIWDHMLFALGVYSALVQGHFEKAGAFLLRMEQTLANERRHGYCHYHFLAGCHRLLKKDLHQAEHHARTAMTIAEETGYVFPIIVCGIEMAHVLHTLGKNGEAKKHVSRSYKLSIRARSKIFEHMCLMTKAWIAFDRGKEEPGRLLLRRAMKLGKEHNYFMHFWWWEPAVTEGLCVKALEAGIETEYAKKIIRVHNFMPETVPDHIENWPWPVKVFVLGQFSLELDGKAVTFGGKTPKKPLELIKAIIAMGGRDVSEDRIIDELWPEASGDHAYKSFEMALQRLRKLMNNEKAIRRQDGMLTLNDRYCWTDVWAFERMLESFEFEVSSSELKDQKGKSAIPNAQSEIMRHLEKALQMYKGHFLPTDARQSWSALARERLRSKFLRLVTKAGEQYEQHNEWKKAVECFERGLERDAVCEEFYQHLMICHNELGHRSEAVKTYERCRAALFDGLGLEPSAKTEKIISSIRGKL